MKKIELTADQKEALETRHKKSCGKRESDRIKAVLLRDENWSTPMIAQALRIHETSVVRYIDDYLTNEKLTLNSGGSEGYLNPKQTIELISHIENNLYHHNHQIVTYVKEEWGATFTVSGMHKWLRRNGFVYKQPKGIPYKADVVAQEDFIDKYTELKASVSPDEPIIFGDGVHPTMATKISHGWIKKGTEKHVKTTASRTRLNIFGSIRLGHLDETLTSQYDTINGESIIDFLHKLRAQYSDYKRIHFILDGAGYHKSKIVTEKAKELNIKIHILPAYSPNLNPIERLWKVMNEHVRNNYFFSSVKIFKERIDDFFQTTLPNIADSLDSRINDNFQRLNPAF